MNLPDTIYAHAKALPPDLQRETLDFIAWIEQRYTQRSPRSTVVGTEAFLERVVGSLGEDFPDDIDDAGLGDDLPRERLLCRGRGASGSG